MLPRIDGRKADRSISHAVALSASCVLLFSSFLPTASFARPETDPSGLRPAANPETRPSDRVPAGSWGGRHAQMEVSDTGAKLELDCASASIEGAIRIDKEGAVAARGLYFQERTGPQREGEEPKGRPTQFTGKLSGKELTLTLLLEDTQEEIGSYTLVLGQAGMLRKCR